MSIFGWLAMGVLCGILTDRVRPGEGPSVDIALGIFGALVGAFVFDHAIGPAPLTAFDLGSVTAAFSGAAIVLILERILVRSRPL